jgi:gas vesicle protein
LTQEASKAIISRKRRKEARHMGRSGDFVAGLFLGTALGVAIGMLMAPQSGEATRELIREKAGEWKGKASEEARVLGEKVKTSVREKADQVAGAVRTRFGREEEESEEA